MLERQYGELHVVHRLDLDTSGLSFSLVTSDRLNISTSRFASVTRTRSTRHASKESSANSRGRIELPLALNWLDRPRQCSLTEDGGGKASATEFVVIGTQQTAGGPKTLVRLSPVTAARTSCVCIAPKGSVAPLTATPFTVIWDLKAKPMPHACVARRRAHPSYIRLPANRLLSRRQPIFRISDSQKRCVAQTDSRIENFCYPSACAMIRKSPVGRACQ